MKEIYLKSEKYDCKTLVDDEFYEIIKCFGWCPSKERDKFYVSATIGYKHTKLHRFVVEMAYDLELGRNYVVDHINGNTLDNRLENLRICTRAENLRNRRQNGYKTDKTTSKYKGVYWKKDKNKFEATIKMNYKKYFLGYFDDEIDAAKAYNEAAIKYHGEFANLNFIEE